MVACGEEKAEIASVRVKRKNGDYIKVMTMCVPPRTNKWLIHTHDKIPNDTMKSRNKIIERKEYNGN